VDPTKLARSQAKKLSDSGDETARRSGDWWQNFGPAGPSTVLKPEE
jgi:hypothetical protein